MERSMRRRVVPFGVGMQDGIVARGRKFFLTRVVLSTLTVSPSES